MSYEAKMRELARIPCGTLLRVVGALNAEYIAREADDRVAALEADVAALMRVAGAAKDATSFGGWEHSTEEHALNAALESLPAHLREKLGE